MFVGLAFAASSRMTPIIESSHPLSPLIHHQITSSLRLLAGLLMPLEGHGLLI
jgi:hypothetical protein